MAVDALNFGWAATGRPASRGKVFTRNRFCRQSCPMARGLGCKISISCRRLGRILTRSRGLALLLLFAACDSFVNSQRRPSRLILLRSSYHPTDHPPSRSTNRGPCGKETAFECDFWTHSHGCSGLHSGPSAELYTCRERVRAAERTKVRPGRYEQAGLLPRLGNAL